jgi:hypothetical protein
MPAEGFEIQADRKIHTKKPLSRHATFHVAKAD